MTKQRTTAFDIIDGDVTTYDNGDVLPSIWITYAEVDENNNYEGHVYLFPYDSQDDPAGEDALFYGGGLYDDGMCLTSPDQAKDRLACFQGAELLYRHAAGKDNPDAYLCLGYVYSYNRCEGKYWRGPLDIAEPAPYPHKERAFECFKRAAEAGIPEACYKLGDAYKNGTGCDVNEGKAFESYQKAAEGAENLPPYITGSIALRLATCFEEGIGCTHDFKRALEYYERAEAFLDAAVSRGDWYYKGALRGARAGITRCKQEISFGEFVSDTTLDIAWEDNDSVDYREIIQEGKVSQYESLDEGV